MNTDHDKYLVLRMPEESAGLDHVLALVRGAIKEAIYLKRILIIDKCTMHEVHNLGHELSLDIERYINLNKTRIYKTDENGSIKELDNPLRLMPAKDFNHNKYSEELVLRLSGIAPISEAQNNKYEVVVRTARDRSYGGPVYPDMLTIALYPSDKVEYLTDMVLRAMGTSLSDTRKRSAVHRGIDYTSNRDTWQNTILDSPLYYACLHARGNDVSTYAYFKQASSSSHIRDIIKQKIPRGMSIYIMTNIIKPGYLSFLEKDYIVYRYYDFPELKNLVSGGKSSVDNAMLYSVEKNILQHAYVKLVCNDAVSRVIYTSCTYKTKWRYWVLSVINDPLKIVRFFKRLTSKILRFPKRLTKG